MKQRTMSNLSAGLAAILVTLCVGCAADTTPVSSSGNESTDISTSEVPTAEASTVESTEMADTFTSEVLPINEDFPQVQFRIDDGLIIVFNASGKTSEKLQELTFGEVTDLDYSREMFAAEDLNFDGSADIMLPSMRGASNVYNYVWLWDEMTKNFVYSEELSALSLLTADPVMKRLTSVESGGASENVVSTYDWVDGRLTLLKEVRSLTDIGSGVVTEVETEREADENTVTVTLEENPTTGYMWNYTMEGTGTLQEIQSEYIKPSSQAMGASGSHIWKFAPIQDGTVTLSFRYSRSWEPSETDTQVVYQYKIENGQIVQLSEEGTATPAN